MGHPGWLNSDIISARNLRGIGHPMNGNLGEFLGMAQQNLRSTVLGPRPVSGVLRWLRFEHTRHDRESSYSGTGRVPTWMIPALISQRTCAISTSADSYHTTA